MIRLAPYIAQRAPLSRRQAEEAIKMGRIMVDGVVTTEFYAAAFETIALDGEALLLPPPAKMWIYYKPVGELVTRFDPQGRPTVFDAVRPQLPDGPLVCVGRLDYESEGLLLLTNNPAVAHSLEKGRLHRCYRVWLRGQLTEERIKELESGMTIDEIYYRPCRVMVERQSDGQSQVLITLTEGKKREIRVLMSSVHQHVTRLMRISFGTFRLGGLTAGNLIPVPDEDVETFLTSITEEKKRNAERTTKERSPLKMSMRARSGSSSEGRPASKPWENRAPRAEGSSGGYRGGPSSGGERKPWAPRTEGSGVGYRGGSSGGESRPWTPRPPRPEGSGSSFGGERKPWAPRAEGSGGYRGGSSSEGRPASKPWENRAPRAEGSSGGYRGGSTGSSSGGYRGGRTSAPPQRSTLKLSGKDGRSRDGNGDGR